MKYFYDCEFIEDGKTVDLISIGIVAEDGREYYAQANEAMLGRANDWVRANVIPHLTPCYCLSNPDGSCPWKSRDTIARQIIEFCNPELYGKPELWGYYAAYDHVALCQLYGAMIALPRGIPMYTRDIKQLCDSLGNPELPKQGKGEHHALADARWNKQAYEFLMNLK